ncbi:dual specificity protein phosphatase 14-like [Asterias amurensis]|uniref:dual specificity protein phosphatase 14-like n=1 Tax=Asterias amurensis TaxID=7602 RepID=UPI003AB243A2
MAVSKSAYHTISELTDFLLISSAYGASSPTHLQVRGITHVINVTLNYQCPMPKYPKDITTTRIPVDDVPSAGLYNYFDKVADIIHDVKKKGGRVLVHCWAGRSRSSTLCIVYLMKYDRMSLRQAHAHVKARRPLIRPNLGFWTQLISYEKCLFGHSSVRMVNSRIGLIPDVYEAEYKNTLW